MVNHAAAATADPVPVATTNRASVSAETLRYKNHCDQFSLASLLFCTEYAKGKMAAKITKFDNFV